VKLSAPAANYSIFLYNPIHRQALANAGYEGILVFSLARQVTWLLPFHAVQIHLVAFLLRNANIFWLLPFHAMQIVLVPSNTTQTHSVASPFMQCKSDGVSARTSPLKY